MTKKLCALCKKEIIGYREISYAKFCSNECYIKNTRINASKVSHLRRKKQEDKECIICKKKYTPIRFTQKTCSSDCRFIHTKNLQKKGRKKLDVIKNSNLKTAYILTVAPNARRLTTTIKR